MSNNDTMINTILNAARNVASTPTIEENNISNLIQNTRSLFRRSSQLRTPSNNDNETPRPQKGRKARRTFKRKVFLLKLANADFLPGPGEQTYLRRRSLGQALNLAQIERSWNLDKIKSYLSSLYPPHIMDLLNMADFNLAKADRSKKLIYLSDIATGSDLEDAIGSGFIIIRPKKDFPSDLSPFINNYQSPTPTSPNYLLDQTNNSDSDFETPCPNRYRRNMDTSNSDLVIRNLYLTDSQETLSDSQYEDQIANENDNFSDLILDFPNVLSSARKMIEVSRDDVVGTMMQLYKDDEIVTKSLFVRFCGELGVDDGGLTRELFTIFWKNLFASANYFKGHDVVVPHVALHMIRKRINDYTIIGRILAHSLLLTHSFPNKLARIIYFVLGDKNLEEYKKDLLLDEYLLYLTVPERRLIKKALKSFNSLSEKEKERLSALFSANQFYDIPKSDEFVEQVLAIAEKVLIKDACDFINEMKKVLPENISVFLNKLSMVEINTLWKKIQPSAEKVMNCLIVETMYTTNEEEKTFFYLQNYVGSLCQEKLDNFLLFVTGGVNLPDKITVTFHKQIGLGRRPIAHTCSSLLELATNFDTQQEFDLEFDEYLKLESSYEYSLL